MATLHSSLSPLTPHPHLHPAPLTFYPFTLFMCHPLSACTHSALSSCHPPHITLGCPPCVFLLGSLLCHLPHVILLTYHSCVALLLVILLTSLLCHDPRSSNHSFCVILLTSLLCHHPRSSNHSFCVTLPYVCHPPLCMSPSLTYVTLPYVCHPPLHMSHSLMYVTLPYICHPSLRMSPSRTYVTLPYICHPPLRMSPSLTYVTLPYLSTLPASL